MTEEQEFERLYQMLMKQNAEIERAHRNDTMKCAVEFSLSILDHAPVPREARTRWLTWLRKRLLEEKAR